MAMNLNLERLANITPADDNTLMNIDIERNSLPTIANDVEFKGSIAPGPSEKDEPKHIRQKDQ